MSLLVEGFLFSSVLLWLVFVFEWCSYADILRIQKRDGGSELHMAGIRATVLNHLVYGPITYAIAIRYCCPEYEHVRPLWQQVFAVLKFLLIENALYYCAHYLMHTR